MTANFTLNKTLESMAIYASKAIAQQAARMPDVINLSFGEPEFGPPAFLQPLIEREGLSWQAFMHSVKGYEQPKGSPELRQAVADWYQQRYGLRVDPEREVMITHGGVEAISLAIQCTTQENQSVIVSQPSYMLYERAVSALNRQPVALSRPTGEAEYDAALNAVGEESPLHQDAPAYLRFGPTIFITAGIMLDALTEENGCLHMATNYRQIAADRHSVTPAGDYPLFDFYDGGSRNGDIVDEVQQKLTWEAITAQAGDMLLFNSFVPHFSHINSSPQQRRVLYLTFNLLSEGEHYRDYYQKKWRDYSNPQFHISTPTAHAALSQ